jgi:integrase
VKRIFFPEDSDWPGPDDVPSVHHLSRMQVERLLEAYKDWFDSAPSLFTRKVRGRYWLSFLCLRFTGARIGEVLKLNDLTDIDFDRHEILITVDVGERKAPRAIPVPPGVIMSLAEYLEEFPEVRGKVFALDQGNFRREFYRRAEEAELPRQLSHPHILRHTRAIELVQAGVPLVTVQFLLGHALSSTTVIYLERPRLTLRSILEDKGLL